MHSQYYEETPYNLLFKVSRVYIIRIYHSKRSLNTFKDIFICSLQ